MSYSLYILKDPRNNDIKYVGITTRVIGRVCKHRNDKINPAKMEWIEELKAHGYRDPILEVVEILDNKEEARIREKILIQQYLEAGIELLNMNAGAKPMDQSHRNKIAAALRQYHLNKKFKD